MATHGGCGPRRKGSRRRGPSGRIATMMDLVLQAWTSSLIEASGLLWKLGSGRPWEPGEKDPKSTRLNSSHLGISYGLFCLQKKTLASPWVPPGAYRGLEATPDARGGPT